MVVDLGVTRVLCNLLVNVLQLNCKILQIQQLPLLHLLIHINIVPFKVLLVIVYTLCKYADHSTLPRHVNAKPSDKQASVLHKGDRKTHVDHSYLLQFCWLAYLNGLLAEWQAFVVQLYQIGDNKYVFYVAINDPPRF